MNEEKISFCNLFYLETIKIRNLVRSKKIAKLCNVCNRVKCNIKSVKAIFRKTWNLKVHLKSNVEHILAIIKPCICSLRSPGKQLASSQLRDDSFGEKLQLHRATSKRKPINNKATVYQRIFNVTKCVNVLRHSNTSFISQYTVCETPVRTL